jgi:peroxiredoxin
VRANRGVFTIDNGVVTSVEMEAPGKLEVSTADACLLGLKK